MKAIDLMEKLDVLIVKHGNLDVLMEDPEGYMQSGIYTTDVTFTDTCKIFKGTETIEKHFLIEC